jgi:peptide/nickel transport system substrate-binding protein
MWSEATMRRIGFIHLILAALIVMLPMTVLSDIALAQGDRVDGGKLVVVFPRQESADAVSLDPIGYGVTYTNSILSAIYDQLVYEDPNSGEIVPGLASSWEISPDSKEYTFHLNKDAVWADGQPVTAEDVQYSLDRAIDPKNLPSNALVMFLISGYDHADIIDPKTVKVFMKFANRDFLQSGLARAYLGMVPKHYVEQVGFNAFGHTKPMGSGPFEFVEWKHGEKIVAKRNPKYIWGPKFTATAGHPPSIAAIEFRFIEDATTRLAALESGQVNAIQGMSPFDQDRIVKSGRYDVIIVRKNGAPGTIALNFQRSPTSELVVRQAMALALNRDDINKTVYADTNFPAYHLLEDKMGRFLNKDAAFPEQNVEKANKLLDDAGWKPGPDGIRVKDDKRLVVRSISAPDTQQAMTMVQAQMRAIGMDFTVRTVSSAQMLQIAAAPEGNYEAAWAIAQGRTNENPSVLRTLFHTESIPPGKGGSQNASRASIPEVDGLIEKAQASTDDAERAKLYGRAQKILTDQVTAIPLLSFNQNYAVVKGVHGIMSDARGTYTYYNDVWLDKSIQGRWQ